MVSDKITLTNSQGLHMRPAGVFASAMAKFDCAVTIRTKDKELNGKSPMMLMCACISVGTEIEIECDGTDEQEALEAALALVESGLGE